MTVRNASDSTTPDNTGAISVSDAARNLFDAMSSNEEDSSATDESAPTETDEVEEGTAAETDTDEVDEDAGSDDGEGDESDQDDEEPTPKSKVQKHKMDIHGEEIEVDTDELKRGYLRQADYTRKTQEAANQRKTAEATVSDARAKREEYATKLSHLEQILVQAEGPEVDWDALRESDPTTFAVRFAEHARHQDKLNQVRAERERVAGEQRAENQRQMQTYLEGEKGKLLEAVPEWKDPAKASVGKKAILDYAKAQGFTDEELGNIFDHRAILMLRKAMQFDEVVTKGREKLQAKVKPVLKPGTVSREPVKSKQATAEFRRAKERLTRTGRANDAALLIEQMLGD